MRRDVVVYTAISEGFDRLAEPALASDRCDFVCFTDAPDPPESERWRFRSFDEVLPGDARRTSRKPKLLPHRYFPDHEFSVWIDANLSILADPATLVRHVARPSLALFRHPDERSAGLEDEARACVQHGKEAAEVLHAQLAGYRSRGYPEPRELPTCMVLVRRHRDARLACAMEDWWRHLRRFSCRDQMSFDFISWEHDLDWEWIEGDVRDNALLRWRPHGSWP